MYLNSKPQTFQWQHLWAYDSKVKSAIKIKNSKKLAKNLRQLYDGYKVI